MKQDLYSVLGVPKEATAEDIQRAYRRKAAKAHPDNIATGNREEFLGLVLARDTLSDPEARSIYDLTGKIPEEGPELPAAIVMIRHLAVECAAKSASQNLVGAIRESLHSGIAQYRNASAKYQQAIDAVEKRWHEDEIREQVLAEFRSRKATMENTRFVAESALELLKNSRYDGIDRAEMIFGNSGLRW